MNKCNRFGVRKIKVGSYSRQGWLMSDRESYAVYDRKWKERCQNSGRNIWTDKNAFMYVKFTEWNNKDFVAAIAKQLNETIGDDVTVYVNGALATDTVLKRDVGTCDFGSYATWCDKFGTGFRPVEKFQKV